MRIGISGWRYAPWRGSFYPEGLRQQDELAHASRQVRSIEINGTFYSLQRPSSFAAWAAATPDDFVFAVKGPRFITHIKRLRDIRAPLANFLASGVLSLGPKLGPILWQLPPSLPFDAARLDEFLTQLPRDTRAAARISREHDRRTEKAANVSGVMRPLRHALEVRHVSFRSPEFIDVLRRHSVAAVVADTAGKWPLIEDQTADFSYVRLHGDEQLYVSGYTPPALRRWQKKIEAWSRGHNPLGAQLISPRARMRGQVRDVFVYFDNDVKVRAPYDAMTLAWMLGTGPKPGAPPDLKSIAETPRTRWPDYARGSGRPGNRGAVRKNTDR
ncbi:MAG TPA: DUF72 domain-containing protein [Candidatus Didemnitutus sp.]|nr:DUF72 domain-containing protein [Candidatus Didemnitutus sp.]